MPQFKFEAKKLTGEELKGEREASDRLDLARDLKSEGYILIDAEEESKKKKLFNFRWLSGLLGTVSLEEKMIFTRNLGVMVGAGLPLSRALEVLSRQTQNPRFKKVILNISSRLSEGMSLSETAKEHPDIFPPIYSAMLKSGEKSGNLEEALKLLAGQMDKDFTLRRKIKGAMIYPAVVVVAMIGIAILMLIFVVPSLVSVFADLEIELPLSTRIVIWFSESLATNSLSLLGILVGIAIFFAWISRKQFFKNWMSTVFLRLPLISSITKKMNTARTARTLSSLVDSGVEILEALDIVTDVLQNVHYKKVIQNAKKQIQKGAAISTAFKAAEDIYPSLLGEMMEVGEETGKLSAMLLRVAIFYEDEVAEATKDMAVIIEPILMIFIGIVVGFFAVAMMKPMYSVVGGF